MQNDAVVSAVQEPRPEDAAVVSYDDFSQAEQQIARTAVEEDFYHACPELPEVLRSFAERFEETEDTYLEYQGTSYGMWIRIEDTVRVDTASAPENVPTCGVI